MQEKPIKLLHADVHDLLILELYDLQLSSPNTVFDVLAAFNIGP